MSISRDGKEYFVICDVCFDSTHYADSFDDAVRCKKAYGWKSRIEDDTWLDICPECQRLTDKEG